MQAALGRCKAAGRCEIRAWGEWGRWDARAGGEEGREPRTRIDLGRLVQVSKNKKMKVTSDL